MYGFSLDSSTNLEINLYSSLSSGHKGSGYITENMMDQATAFSTEPNHAPLQRGLRTDKRYFDWYTEPEQDAERHRFGVAMKGTTAMSANLVLDRECIKGHLHKTLIYLFFQSV